MNVYERRYAEKGKLAHLVVVGQPGFICNTTSGSYLGAESPEREIAGRMPLCGRCTAAKAER